jgi:hypothetical protein
MDQNIKLQIIQTLKALFSDIEVKEEDKPHLGMIKKLVSALSIEDRSKLASELLADVLPIDNAKALYFFLFDIFKDANFIDLMFSFMPARISPAWYYDLFWSLSRMSFIGQQIGGTANKNLRLYHKQVSAETNAFLDNMGMRVKKKAKGVRNIAIISPQILNMRHSPTREAFNLALHLDTFFGCNTYIINTNALTYKNIMGAVEPFSFHANDELKGAQAISIDYMNFKQKDVRIISFEPEPMSTRKLANILDALNQLKIDAVIAHGENLLLQEAVFGVWPSVFATTGAVVPFAHSDAYFVPGHLFNQRHNELAQEYGHSDFMLESMLVTPEGKAEITPQKMDFSIDQNHFVYLIVGTRLENELSTEFIQVCSQLLDDESDCVIAFAGSPTLSLTEYFSAEIVLSKRVINLGFQDNLAGVCKMADVFLNPYRQGGGTSSQTAILNGLPIVTFDYGHISAVVPKELRHLDWNSYLDFAKGLKQRPDFYLEWQQKLEAHFVEHLDTKTQVSKIYQKLIEIASIHYQ